jgi:hypothetical protein
MNGVTGEFIVLGVKLKKKLKDLGFILHVNLLSLTGYNGKKALLAAR